MADEENMTPPRPFRPVIPGLSKTWTVYSGPALRKRFTPSPPSPMPQPSPESPLPTSMPAEEPMLSEDSDEEVEVKKKTRKQDPVPRQSVLLTISHADLGIKQTSSRRQVASFLTKRLDSEENPVLQWACSIEMHKTDGIHFHLAVKMKKQRRFREMVRRVYEDTGIVVNVREWHTNYYDAYRYVKKHDTHHILSENHPPLANPPATAAPSTPRKAIAKLNASPTLKVDPPQQKKPFKEPRLTNVQVAHMIRDNGVKTDKSLKGLAKKMANEGKQDLWNWLAQHPSAKLREDLLDTVWGMEDSEAKEDRENKTRLEILKEELDKPCAVLKNRSCDGIWLVKALDLLAKNKIPRAAFAKQVLNPLVNGRGKGRNLILIGGADRGKSFLLKPLTMIYDAFTSPSEGSYNWVSVHEKELVLLIDLRYDENGKGDREVMEWGKLLNMLDGWPVNIAMPKNHYAKDVVWDNDAPIFATSDREIVRVIGNKYDEGESEQMRKRWMRRDLAYKLRKGEVDYNIISCGRCFAELLLFAGVQLDQLDS